MGLNGSVLIFLMTTETTPRLRALALPPFNAHSRLSRRLHATEQETDADLNPAGLLHGTLL